MPRTGLFVELLLRDEHCPPHLHVENEESVWEARFAFCFISNAVKLMDIDPVGNAPGRRLMDQIKRAIAVNLMICRAAWWNSFYDCCLTNRGVLRKEKNFVTLLTKRQKGSVQIHEAQFIPSNNLLKLTLRDGASFDVLCGTGDTQ